MKKNLQSLAFAAFAAAALVTQSLWAQTNYYWDANDTAAGFGIASGTWGTDAFISTDPAGLLSPALTATTANDDLNLGNSTNGLATGTVGVNGSQSISNLTVGAASGAITLSGDTISMFGNLFNSSANLLTVGNAITITNFRSFTTSTNGGDITVAGVIGGTGGNISKRGAGTLLLSAANTNTAGINIYEGTVKRGADGVFRPGATTIFKGTLDIAGFNEPLTNFPGLILGAANQNSLAGSGASVIDSVGGGLITFGNGNSQKIRYYASTNQDNGPATISANLALGTGNTQIYVEKSANSGSADLTISGAMSGIQVIKINSGTNSLTGLPWGLGTLVLSGSNTFTGALSISCGTLVGVGNAPIDGTPNWCGAAPSTTAVNLGNSTTFNNFAPTLLLGGAYQFDRIIQLGSSSVAAGVGAYNATIGGRNTSGTATFTGPIWLLAPNTAAYTLTLQAASGGTVAFTNGAGGGYFANTPNKTIFIGSPGNNGIVNIFNSMGVSSGAINVNYGTLLMNGDWSLQTGAWTVTNGATMGGRGLIGGAVTMLAGAIATNAVTFDTNGVVNSQLTFTNTLTLNGNAMNIFTTNVLAAGDYLLWTNTANAISGSFASSVTVGGAGVSGTASIVTTSSNVVLNVASATPSPTNITYSVVSGNQLVLSWPNGQGWLLESQTNNLSTGLGNNWVTNTGATSPFTNTIDPTQPAVFYRLKY